MRRASRPQEYHATCGETAQPSERSPCENPSWSSVSILEISQVRKTRAKLPEITNLTKSDCVDTLVDAADSALLVHVGEHNKAKSRLGSAPESACSRCGTHVEGGLTPSAASLLLVISAVFMQVQKPACDANVRGAHVRTGRYHVFPSLPMVA